MADAPRSPHVLWHAGLDRAARWGALGVRGATVWLTGLSGSGKSSIAVGLETTLIERGVPAYRLDGDNVRHGLNGNLGFSAEDRQENIRRVAEVACLLADAGLVAVASFISPYQADRDRARARHVAADLAFFEVFVDTPLAVCEARDPKGLYRKARAGEILEFTGVSAPYERPTAPELRLDTTQISLEQCVVACLRLLEDHGVGRRAAPLHGTQI